MPSLLTAEPAAMRKRAVAMYETGDPIGAVQMARKSVQAAEETLGRDNPVTGESLSTLGTLLFDQQRYDDAEACFVRSLEIMERVSSPTDLGLIGDLNNLALLYRAQGRYNEAKLLLERALTIHGDMPGQGTPQAARTFNSLALVYHSERDFDNADKLYRRALAIREATPATQPRDVAESLNNLAELCSERGEFVQAEAFYVRSLEMQRHATTLENLSLCLAKQGRRSECEAPLREALELRMRALGPDHAATRHCANLLASYYDGRKMVEEAERLRRRVAPSRPRESQTPLQILKAKVVRALASLSRLPKVARTMKRYHAAGPRVRALVAHAEVEDPEALGRLLAPLPNPEEFRSILSAGKQGFYFVFQETPESDQVIARYIWVIEKQVVVFSLITLSKDQAQRVMVECAKLRMVDQPTFRAAVRAAIGVEV